VLVNRLARRLVAGTGETSTTFAPFTGQPIATLALSSVDDVAEATARARAAQQDWARTPVEARARVLLRYHDLVLDRQAELLDLAQWETGKARRHAFEEVAHVALTARYYGRRGPRQIATRRRLGLLPGLTRTEVVRHPKGVIGVISPWNYPLVLAVCDALPALLAGNAIVHKPDRQSPLTALLGVDLLHAAGLPEGLWQLVNGEGGTIGGAIVDNVDHVCFTGSTRSGREVATRAARRLVGCSLELGGKNPMLVLADADLERAAEGAERACFSSAGQLCVAIERIYIAAEVYDAFLDRFLARIRAMRISAAFDFTADMGSLVSADRLAAVEAHVDDAVSRGAKVLIGGERCPEAGPLFYAPTVLEGVTDEMLCFAEETFGPVVAVYRCCGDEEAVKMANGGDYGLNASVWTRDARRGRRVAAAIRAGSVNVNEAYAASFGSLDAPMGGMRDSGLGRRQAADGILRYTEPQTIATQRVVPIAPTLGMSAGAYAKVMTSALKAMKRARRP
jgi:succinate-semialdehyde dehydrogenase/glutarate-semialdehyde dehydrogenase